jgi:hypothetical protein
MGCSQVVRHRNLDPTFKGSNPFIPDFTSKILLNNKFNIRNYFFILFFLKKKDQKKRIKKIKKKRSKKKIKKKEEKFSKFFQEETNQLKNKN